MHTICDNIILKFPNYIETDATIVETPETEFKKSTWRAEGEFVTHDEKVIKYLWEFYFICWKIGRNLKWLCDANSMS